MKKIIYFFIAIACILIFAIKPVYAQEVTEKENFDNSISEILGSINEDDYIELKDLLNELFSDNKSFKEWIVAFLTGENVVNFNNVKEYFINSISSILPSVIEMVCYVLFVGILYSVSNIIICKKTDNNGNNAIYFICYSVVITLFVYLFSKVFSTATQSVEKMTKTVETCFPLLLTLGEFCGGFGNGLFKPITLTSSFISSVVFSRVFIPIISVCFICVVVGNVSPSLKLGGLSKTLISLIKWIIGIITIVFGVVIASHGAVNAQYSGLSFKIFKYATGTMIPIVGNFISGGLDTLVSSAIIVKNSVGLLIILYLIFTALRSGLLILLTSFILRFFMSISEPILDNRFVNVAGGVCEILNVLCATVFISSFSYVLVCLTVVNSTTLIV